MPHGVAIRAGATRTLTRALPVGFKLDRLVMPSCQCFGLVVQQIKVDEQSELVCPGTPLPSVLFSEFEWPGPLVGLAPPGSVLAVTLCNVGQRVVVPRVAAIGTVPPRWPGQSAVWAMGRYRWCRRCGRVRAVGRCVA